MINNFSANKSSGYSLVEVLIAITILLLALAGPLTIASKGLQSAYFAREQATALYLAQEGMEMVIALRNQAYIAEINAASPDFSAIWTDDWAITSGGLSRCTSSDGCGFDSRSALQSTSAVDPLDCGSDGTDCRLQFDESGSVRYVHDTGSSLPDSLYTRIINIDDTVSDAVDVTVTVRWETPLFAGAAQEVVLRSTLYNYLSDFTNL